MKFLCRIGLHALVLTRSGWVGSGLPTHVRRYSCALCHREWVSLDGGHRMPVR